MRSWRQCLDAAGIRANVVRADYSVASRYLQRREFVARGTLRVLFPPRSQPHAIAAYALGRYTDDLCDHGPVDGRAQRFDEWATQVGTALDTGHSRHPLIRAYLHSAGLLNLSRSWMDAYLAGTRIDVDFAGFACEVNFQHYVDTVTLPSCMFLSGAVARLVPEQRYISSLRLVAEGQQRADFLTDLYEDLREGRLNLPVADLDWYGVTRADLREGLDTPAVRALITATANSARATLIESERILGEIAPDYRAFFRCAIGAAHMRVNAVQTSGAAVIRGPYRDAPVAALQVMVGSRRLGTSTRPLQRPGGSRKRIVISPLVAASTRGHPTGRVRRGQSWIGRTAGNLRARA